MALSFKDPETNRLAREVASLTGETLTETVRRALEQRLRYEQLKRGTPPWDEAAVQAILDRSSALPLLDSRSDEDILGYGDDGLPA